MRKLLSIASCFLLLVPAVLGGEVSVKPSLSAMGDFPLVVGGRTAEIHVDPEDAEVVLIAAGLLADDVERVSGKKPEVSRRDSRGGGQAPIVVIGTLGKNAAITDLVQRGLIDGASIEGKWESYVVTTVTDPFPGVRSALVIAGSDRRGTAYGVFEVSKAIGVSPWVWWADVAPRRRETLVIATGTHVQGPPSVRYRGIFINDEDWGLQPWAARTFEPETGDIGPKTYAKVCELLLRLKANYLWPAMHDCTKAFNLYPENKLVADRYAIVMGSSHAEPMLRNNVSEWPHDQATLWNPVTNLPGILDYWEQRVRENGRFENVYTMGMRGIHDSSMPGGGSIDEKRERLEKIVGLQREMLSRHVDPEPARVPQIFCPYKEVLEIYQSGMKLPEDITIVWPDDNFGYIRQLPDAQERKRSGGHGIYYHISYWGRPHDYLWLDTTPPALIWTEMTKAYAFGARRLWVVNVGDIKSIETGMTFFLELAWDVGRYNAGAQRAFLHEFCKQQFGAEYAEAIAGLKDEYYRLCAVRRPEHMGFNRVYPNTPVQNGDWSHGPEEDEAGRLLDRWLELARGATALSGRLPEDLRSAYFQLVEYPVCAGAAMAEKLIMAEKARRFGSGDFAARAEAALRRIETLTGRYNALSGGKWRGIMDHRPRRIPVFDMPPTTAGEYMEKMDTGSRDSNKVVIDPTKFDRTQDHDGSGWRVVEGLSPRGAAITVLPHKDAPTLRGSGEIRRRASVVEYSLTSESESEVEVTIEALPTHRLTPSHEVIVAVAIGNDEPVVVPFDQGNDDERDPTWQTNVLRGTMSGKATVRVPRGDYTLRLFAVDAGVVVHRIILVPDK